MYAEETSFFSALPAIPRYVTNCGAGARRVFPYRSQ